MKKILPFFVAALLLSSCQKDPDMSELDDKFVVYTNYDKSANFSSYTTYYLPDSIMVIGGSDSRASFWTDANEDADQVLAAIEQNMNNKGFVRTTDKANADLGIQSSYVESINYFVDYYDYPYWWWGYPYYWDPTYWGWWDGGWYYPYPVVFSYSVGSLLNEIVDLKSASKISDDAKVTVLWTSYDGGLLTGNNDFDVQQAVDAVNQSFAQSPYLKK